jgi:hypothetical protein
VSLGGAAACTASGSDTTQHGPVFDDDAGSDAHAPHDAGTTDAARDASETSDAASSDARGGDGAPDDGSTDAAPGDAFADVVTDARGDASDASLCTSSTGLLAGGATSLAGASFTGTQVSAAVAIAGSAAAPIALLPFGTGFVGVGVASDRSLYSTTYASSWSAPNTVGSLGSRDAPALAVVGTSLHLAYQAASPDAAKDYKFFHGVMNGGAWDGALDPIGTGASQSFGQSGPTAASAASTLVVAQSGTDGFVYDQTLDVTWQAAHQQASTSVEIVIRPTLVALAGGASDLLIVYARKTDRHFMFATRTAGTWSSPVEVYNQGGVVAYANDPVTMAAMPGGGAVLAYLGGDGKPYFSRFTAGTWSAPATIAAGTVLSVPSIAPGVCGDDAIAAFVGSAGDVNIASLRGATWSAQAPIPGATGMKYAAVATRP